MKLELFASYELDRCYAIAPLTYQGKKHILVAAEKVNDCILFDEDGNKEDVIWHGPGGTMSMIQVPGTDGWFLATHQFYSPNDGANAHIVLVRPSDDGWKIQTIKDLPFCHRFSIVTRGGVNYIIGNIVEFYYEDGEYKTNILAEDVGSANIYPYEKDGQLRLVSTNREISQIAFYNIQK